LAHYFEIFLDRKFIYLFCSSLDSCGPGGGAPLATRSPTSTHTQLATLRAG